MTREWRRESEEGRGKSRAEFVEEEEEDAEEEEEESEESEAEDKIREAKVKKQVSMLESVRAEVSKKERECWAAKELPKSEETTRKASGTSDLLPTRNLTQDRACKIESSLSISWSQPSKEWKDSRQVRSYTNNIPSAPR